MRKPLNIAVIGSTIPPVMGGLEVYTFELARQLSRQGHRVFLIGYRDYRGRSFTPHEIIDGVEVYRLPSRAGLWPNGKLLYFNNVARQLKRIYKKFPLDIIHANTVVPAGLGARVFKIRHRGIPLVVTSHGYEVLVRPRNPLYKFLTRRVFAQTGLVIGVSAEVASASVAAGAAEKRTVNWSNPVDTGRFCPGLTTGSAVRAKYGISPDEIVVLSLRRLHPKTGVQYLVAAAPAIVSRIKKIKFLIVGDGELKESLEKSVAEKGLEKHFIFAGSVPNDLIQDYVAAADLSVFASLAEATSIACLEVMAACRPVVTSDVGGLPEIVTDGYNGFLVKFPKNISDYQDFGLAPEVIADLGAAIIKLAADRQLRTRMGQDAGRKVAANFSWDKYVSKLLIEYERLIDENIARV